MFDSRDHTLQSIQRRSFSIILPLLWRWILSVLVSRRTRIPPPPRKYCEDACWSLQIPITHIVVISTRFMIAGISQVERPGAGSVFAISFLRHMANVRRGGILIENILPSVWISIELKLHVFSMYFYMLSSITMRRIKKKNGGMMCSSLDLAPAPRKWRKARCTLLQAAHCDLFTTISLSSCLGFFSDRSPSQFKRKVLSWDPMSTPTSYTTFWSFQNSSAWFHGLLRSPILYHLRCTRFLHYTLFVEIHDNKLHACIHDWHTGIFLYLLQLSYHELRWVDFFKAWSRLTFLEIEALEALIFLQWVYIFKQKKLEVCGTQ